MKILKIIPVALIVFFTMISCNNDDDNVEETSSYSANLTSLNDSGASGIATVTVVGNSLTVTINASGMVENQLHPQHIHGLEDSTNATCPPQSADVDNDGIITVPEGAPFYGGILLPLEDFPTADANGAVSFTKTFTLGENDVLTAEVLGSIENRVIVLHGLNNNGAYVPTIPVACGQLTKI